MKAAMVWLHGTLNVTIYEGKNIPLDRVLRFHVKAGLHSALAPPYCSSLSVIWLPTHSPTALRKKFCATGCACAQASGQAGGQGRAVCARDAPLQHVCRHVPR